MMRVFKRFKILSGLLLLSFSPVLVIAADLQIEDHNRLVRVLADVKHAQRVEILLSAAPQSLSLENLDGLQQKLQAGNISTNSVSFAAVEPGVWRIKVRPKSIAVLNVSIINN